MEEEMSSFDVIPRLEKWLEARGLPAEEILKCTQYVHTGDPEYIVNEKKDQATEDSRDLT